MRMLKLDVAQQTGVDKHGSTVTSVPSAAAPLRGTLAGRFRLLRVLGSGAMGVVYESEDLQLERRIALKVLRPEVAANREMVERFRREVAIGRQVTDTNVCRVFDIGCDRSDDGTETWFQTMELLTGETLAARIRRGAVPEREALPLLLDLAAGLSAIHRAGIVHRDVKSSNIMLTLRDRPRAVLTDFGLSSPLHTEPDRDEMAGTIPYMAPEQIRCEKITPATDIYACGVVMYETLTGKRPFASSENSEILMSHLTGAPRPPREIAPCLQEKWDTLILTCLGKRPEERFSSAVQLRAELFKMLQQPAATRRKPARECLRRAAGRNLTRASTASGD